MKFLNIPNIGRKVLYIGLILYVVGTACGKKSVVDSSGDNGEAFNSPPTIEQIVFGGRTFEGSKPYVIVEMPDDPNYEKWIGATVYAKDPDKDPIYPTWRVYKKSDVDPVGRFLAGEEEVHSKYTDFNTLDGNGNIYVTPKRGELSSDKNIGLEVIVRDNKDGVATRTMSVLIRL